MRKAIIEFNLTQGTEDLTDAMNGWKWKMVVGDIDSDLRNDIKYNPNKYSEEVLSYLEKLRENIRDKCFESELYLD